MVDAVLSPVRNVIDFAPYRRARAIVGAQALCRHCGAALGEGEGDDDCSSAGLNALRPAPRISRKFRAE